MNMKSGKYTCVMLLLLVLCYYCHGMGCVCYMAQHLVTSILRETNHRLIYYAMSCLCFVAFSLMNVMPSSSTTHGLQRTWSTRLWIAKTGCTMCLLELMCLAEGWLVAADTTQKKWADCLIISYFVSNYSPILSVLNFNAFFGNFTRLPSKVCKCLEPLSLTLVIAMCYAVSVHNAISQQIPP